MAREIVITSVPRGVKLGRTGFQVAMQTAGMRDDVAAHLEKMAGYRHLAAGVNPVCYFHRHARTVAGPLNVIGRIVDAGVDFSNRSNKLAHMVVLEQADLAAVGGSSPAAVLKAVEGRLATTWPGGPEERQAAFNLAGIPPSHPAPCGTWQQVMGDAGWAGVLADRAVRGQPTLIIGPDSSPASCSRMLALFQEALAIVPPAKRWAVTFDTTTLAPDGVLWRGTYAGSPESQATQPGLLVVDLGRPQPLPADLAVGDLVLAARTGQGPAAAAAAAVPMRPAVPAGPAGPRPVGGPAGTFAGTGPAGLPAVPVGGPLPVNGNSYPGVGPARPMPVGPPAPPPGGDGLLPPEPARKGWTGGLVAGLITLVLLLGIGIAGVAVVIGMNLPPGGKEVAVNPGGGNVAPGGGKAPSGPGKTKPAAGGEDEIAVAQALAKVQAYTNDSHSNSPPTIADYQMVLGAGKTDHAIHAIIEFVNSVLALKPHEGLDRTAVLNLVKAAETIQDPGRRSDVEACRTLLQDPDFGQEAAALLAKVAPPWPFEEATAFRAWAEACKQMVALAGQKPGERGHSIPEPLWGRLVSEATTRDGKDSRDYSQAEEGFRKAFTPRDLASLDALADAVRRAAKPPFVPPSPDAAATAGTTPGPQKPPPPKWDPGEDAFKKLQAAIAKAKQDGGAGWPLPAQLSSEKIPGLDAEVVVGTTAGFEPQAVRDGDKPEWRVMHAGQCLAVVSLAEGVAVTRGDAPAEVWAKHESQFKSMPIAFRRPGRPVGKDDWFMLAAGPSEATFAEGTSLRDLLCAAEGTVPLPLPEGASPPTAWDQKERPVLADASSPVKVSVRPVGGKGNEFELLFTARIGDRDRTLAERFTVDAATRQIRRAAKPWSDRESRLKRYKVDSFPERNALGLRDVKNKGVEFVQRVAFDRCMRPILDETASGQAHTYKSQGFHVAWFPDDEIDNDTSGKKNAQKTLDDWPPVLRAFIACPDRGFYAQEEPKYRREKFVEPQIARKKDEKDEEFENRKRAEIRQKKEEHEAEQDRKAKAHVEQAAADPAALRAFVAERERERDAAGKPLRLDAELAAIHVLLGLDGFMVAKAYQEEIERLLDRIPVGSLLAGESALEWTIAGRKEGPVRVLAGRIKPAPVPAAQPSEDGLF